MTDSSRGRLRQEGGATLLVALTALALLSSIAALAVLQARSDYLVHRYTRDGATAFAIAEAGLTLALADLQRDARFSRLAAATGSRYPFLDSPPPFFPHEPLGFEVTIAARDTDHLEIVSQSFGAGRAQSRVVASIGRGSEPYVPAALHTEASAPSVLLGDRFHIHASNQVSGLGLPDPGAARALIAALDTATLARIDGTPPIAANDAGPVSSLIDRVTTTGQALGAEISGDLGRGLFYAPSALAARDTAASGILVVDGDLNVDSSFRFEGVLIVRGDLLFGEGSDVQILGATLQQRPGVALHLRGEGAITYDPALLQELDDEFTALFERRATVEGWRDDS